jgi:hypothetical protein
MTLLGIVLIVALPVLVVGLFTFGLCQACRAGDDLAERALQDRRALRALDGMGADVDDANVTWLFPDRRPELHSIDGGHAA